MNPVSTVKWFFLSILAGTIAAVTVIPFLWSLDKVSTLFITYPQLIFGLPLAGFGIGLLYHFFGKDVDSGNKILVKELENPEKPVPAKIGWLVFLTTLTTHLFGGSAGREGTAVQLAGSFADVISKPFNLSELGRSTWIRMLISAGFGAVFGTPLAGAIFGLEIRADKTHTLMGIIPCLIASFLGDFVTRLVITHGTYSITHYPVVHIKTIGLVLLCGLCFGIFARLFIEISHTAKKLCAMVISKHYWKAFLGGSLLAAGSCLIYLIPYLGLGLPLLSKSFHHTVDLSAPFLKATTTLITLTSGFKGGEVTPLFVMGSTLGNVLSQFIPLPLSFLAGLGLCTVFSSAARTPLTGILLGLELFGLSALPWVVLSCYAGYFIMGQDDLFS